MNSPAIQLVSSRGLRGAVRAGNRFLGDGDNSFEYAIALGIRQPRRPGDGRKRFDLIRRGAYEIDKPGGPRMVVARGAEGRTHQRIGAIRAVARDVGPRHAVGGLLQLGQQRVAGDGVKGGDARRGLVGAAADLAGEQPQRLAPLVNRVRRLSLPQQNRSRAQVDIDAPRVQRPRVSVFGQSG